MGLINQHVPNLIGGVSQQAPSQRLVNQSQFQENCLNSLVQGMRKRPNTELLGKLQNPGVRGNSFVHQIYRDDFEKYVVLLDQDVIEVYDRDTGTLYPVRGKELSTVSKEYLKFEDPNATPRTAYQAITSADSTFILNTTKKVLPYTNDTPMTGEPIRETLTFRNKSSGGSSGGGSGTHTPYRDPSNIVFIVNGVRKELGRASASTMAKEVHDVLVDEYPDYTVTLYGNVVYVDRLESEPAVSIEEDHDLYWYNPLIPGWQYSIYKESLVTVSTGSPSVATYSDRQRAIIFIRQADYSVNYKVYINGREDSYRTVEATEENARAELSTQLILGNLATAIGSPPDVTVSVYNEYILVEADEGEELTIDVSDDLHGDAIGFVKDSIDTFGQLPGKAPHGYMVYVRGAADVDDNGYWVRFIADGLESGHWEESRDPYAYHRIDLRSMPHVLSRKQHSSFVAPDNPLGIYFEFAEGSWEEREFGDNETSPYPSFVSTWDDENNRPLDARYITSMAFYQNRLIFASGEHVVLSESGNYWNFWPTTARTVVDSDRIDIQVLSKEINPIRAMVAAANDLILFGERQQFALRSNDGLTASTIYTVPLTTFDADLRSEPAVVGPSVYFPVNRERFNGIFDMYVREQSQVHDADEVTAHCPEYIKGRVRKIVPALVDDMLLVVVDDSVSEFGHAKRIYAYNYKMRGNERVQSAWNTWTFTGEVVDLHIEGSTVTFVMSYSDGLYTEQMNLSEDSLRDTFGFPVYMDRREYFDEEPTGQLPDGQDQFEYNDGEGVHFWCRGYPYTQTYEFSPFFLRVDGKAVLSGRLQMRRLKLVFDETTNFDVTVDATGRGPRTESYQGRILGQELNTLNSVPVIDGDFNALLLGKPNGMRVVISNDAPHDCRLQSAEWEGFYYNRARGT